MHLYHRTRTTCHLPQCIPSASVSQNQNYTESTSVHSLCLCITEPELYIIYISAFPLLPYHITRIIKHLPQCIPSASVSYNQNYTLSTSVYSLCLRITGPELCIIYTDVYLLFFYDMIQYRYWQNDTDTMRCDNLINIHYKMYRYKYRLFVISIRYQYQFYYTDTILSIRYTSLIIYLSIFPLPLYHRARTIHHHHPFYKVEIAILDTRIGHFRKYKTLYPVITVLSQVSSLWQPVHLSLALILSWILKDNSYGPNPRMEVDGTWFSEDSGTRHFTIPGVSVKFQHCAS